MGCHDGEKIQGFWLNVYLGHPYSKTGFQPTDAIYRLVWYGTQEKKTILGEVLVLRRTRVVSTFRTVYFGPLHENAKLLMLRFQ